MLELLIPIFGGLAVAAVPYCSKLRNTASLKVAFYRMISPQVSAVTLYEIV